MVTTLRVRVKSPGRRAAFTLAEVLVAIVILTLITLVMASIFSGTSRLVSRSNTSMNALDAGEAVLSQIGLDVSRLVLRDDVDYDFTKQTGDDRLSFYARTTGFDASGNAVASPRPLAVVSYAEGANPANPGSTARQLNYGALQIAWNSGGSSPFAPSGLVSGVQTQNLFGGDLPLPTFYTTLASEVIRFEYSFMLKSDPAGNTPPKLLIAALPSPLDGVPPIENVAGILVGIVVVDPRSRALFPAGADATLAGKFKDAADQTDFLTEWSPSLTPATLKAVGIPAPAIEGIRIYQRYYPFPW